VRTWFLFSGKLRAAIGPPEDICRPPACGKPEQQLLIFRTPGYSPGKLKAQRPAAVLIGRQELGATEPAGLDRIRPGGVVVRTCQEGDEPAAAASNLATWAPTSSTLISGLQHFPEVRGYAAPEVAGRAAWEAEFNKTSKYWTSRFPGELPETPVVPEVLNTDEILVDSQVRGR